jgi:hypothetical protein
MAQKNTIKHPLAYPIEVDGEKITEIELRRPKGADMRKALNMTGAGEITASMIINLAEVSPKVVDELDGEDFMALSVIVGNFMGKQSAGTPKVTAP